MTAQACPNEFPIVQGLIKIESMGQKENISFLGLESFSCLHDLLQTPFKNKINQYLFAYIDLLPNDVDSEFE